MSTPLIVGAAQIAELHALRSLAAERPIDMGTLAERLATGDGKAAHMRQMGAQTVEIPIGFLVTFSIEIGHPCGAARHMSMSSTAANRVPSPEAAWMIATELGFVGGLERCTCYPERLLRGDRRAVALNVVQPIADAPGGTA